MEMSNIEKHFVNRDSHSLRVSRRAARMLLEVQPQPGQRYLDIGSGNGKAPINIAATFGLHVTGVDIDEAHTQLARKNSQGLNNIHFQTADAADLPFKDGEFDIVSTSKALHHFPEQEAALLEMARVLRPGGTLLFVDLVAPAWVESLAELAGIDIGTASKALIENTLLEAGLELLRSSSDIPVYQAIFRK